MAFPVPVTLLPMEATSVAEIPSGEGWQYEPKWDGFRCLAFRDGDQVELQSKSGQPLGRYFPEIVEAVKALGGSGARAKGKSSTRFVLDGELVIPLGAELSFDALLQRIHPAASRIQKLARETPACLIVFDLLAEGGETLLSQPLRERRRRLEAFASAYLSTAEKLRLSPATTDLAKARRWFGAAGAALDGLIAKRIDAPYAAGTRDAMVKIKPRRTADCVVGGFRYAEKKKVVGSLLLGLYDDEGLLHHVGFCAAFKTAERPALTKKLEPLIEPPGFTGKAPGGPSRWSTKRSTEWQPLKPTLVVEVQFDHVTGGRFRHGTTFWRWRPDKAPRQCTMQQLQQKTSTALSLLLAPGQPRKGRVRRSKATTAA
jgi:ATP-dependent DNA ligase